MLLLKHGEMFGQGSCSHRLLRVSMGRGVTVQHVPEQDRTERVPTIVEMNGNTMGYFNVDRVIKHGCLSHLYVILMHLRMLLLKHGEMYGLSPQCRKIYRILQYVPIPHRDYAPQTPAMVPQHKLEYGVWSRESGKI